MDYVVAHLGGKTSQQYVAGQSMGGKGAWEIAAQNPDRFAALVPICASLGPPENNPAPIVDALKATPMWAFHSADDIVVPAGKTDGMVEALRAVSTNPGSVKYTRYETAPACPPPHDHLKGHASYDLAFAEAELYPWLLTHSK